MQPRDLAIEYLKYFCSGDIEGLKPLLAEDLQFRGTFHVYHSRDEYLHSLHQDPPENCAYTLLSVTEGEDAAAVFYTYHKPQRDMQVAQLFKINAGKIEEVLLIFDGRG